MRKRILTCLILILCVITCCFALASCKKKKSSATESAKDGKAGVSIERIEYDSDGNLVVTLTDGTTQTVVPPENQESGWTEGLHFVEKEDGSYRVAGLGIASEIDIVIPDTYKGSPVTEISDSAFWGQSNIKSITVPSSVTTIGYQAFYGCEDLQTVTLSEGLLTIREEAFSNCSSLGSLSVPASVQNIGDKFLSGSGVTTFYFEEGATVIPARAFEGCQGLFSITIPDTIISIGEYAFYDCDSLYSVSFGNGVANIGVGAFYDCDYLTTLAFGTSIEYIGTDAFAYCDSLSTVSLADVAPWCGVTFENVYAQPMYYASSISLNGYSLSELVIPEGVTEISDLAFYNCDSIQSLTVASTVTEIGDYAFYGATDLNVVTLSDGVETIGEFAFASCGDVSTVSFGSGISYIGQQAFVSTEIGVVDICDVAAWCDVEFEDITSSFYVHPLYVADELWIGGESVTELAIPTGVETVGAWAFAFMPENVTDVEISQTVETVGSHAFYQSLIVELVLPESVSTVGTYAFSGSSYLESIGIPSEVYYVSEYSFKDCDALTVYYEGSSYNYNWASYWNYSNCPVIYNWNPDGVTYSFEENGAEQTDDVFSYFAIELPELTYDEYVLVGWYTASDFSGTRYTNEETYYSSSDVILYARWMTESEYDEEFNHDGSSFARAITAYAGTTYYVSITSSSQSVYYKFTPTSTGYYRIYSSNNNGDPYGYVYDSAYSQLAYDDDSSGRNFSMNCYMYAGNTYYIRAYMYGGGTGSYSLHIVRN